MGSQNLFFIALSYNFIPIVPSLRPSSGFTNCTHALIMLRAVFMQWHLKTNTVVQIIPLKCSFWRCSNISHEGFVKVTKYDIIAFGACHNQTTGNHNLWTFHDVSFDGLSLLDSPTIVWHSGFFFVKNQYIIQKHWTIWWLMGFEFTFLL